MENIDKQKKTKQRKQTLFGILKCILSALILITAITYTSLEISDLKSEGLEFNGYSPTFEGEPYWVRDWETLVRTTSKREYKKKIDVYYGHVFKDADFSELGENTDLNQVLTFTLIRTVYKDWPNTSGTFLETEIFSFDSTLSYFLEDDFYYKNNYFTDTITAKELLDAERKQDPIISYTFSLVPKNEEELKLYPYGKDLFSWNILKSQPISAYVIYDVDFRGKIAFEIAEREEEGVKY